MRAEIVPPATPGVTRLEESHRLASPAFIVFSDDWGEHMSSSQHIFRRIAAQHPVLWVNTIGMRTPTLSPTDLRKAWRKVSAMWSSRTGDRARIDHGPRADRRRDADHSLGSDHRLDVTVCQPFMLPFSRVGAVRSFNARSVCRIVRSRLSGAGRAASIVVSTVPNAGDYTDLLRGSTVVYYCVDDFAQWPGLDSGLVRDMEDRLIARADVLIATSPKLFERLSARGKPTHLLTHGVDVEHFSRIVDAEHERLRGIPRPRAGFFGLIDGRMDQKLMVDVATALPDFRFVFAGPIECDTARLAARPNVRFTGPVRYEELPSLIAGLDVLLIPYATGELSDALSPLKLKEYLATGKPIVSTPIAEARSWSEHVGIAGTSEEWKAALRAALGADVSARRRAILPILAPESWAAKARAMLDICAG